MSSDAPQSPSDDPPSANFWSEYYRGECDTYAAENTRLKGEVELLKLQHRKEIDKLNGEKDGLKGKYDEISGKLDEVKSENEELKRENAFLRRQLEMAEAGQSRTPSRATTSETGIGLRTPPSSSKGTSPPLNARRSRACGASESPQDKDKEEESSSEDENLADFARRIRAQTGPRNGAGRRREQRQERRDARQEGAEWAGPHPIRWGPKPGATKDKGKQTRKRDAPDESSDSDTPLVNRGNSPSGRASGSSKRTRLEGVFPPPSTTGERRGYTPISSTPPPSSSLGAVLVYPLDEDEDEDESEDEIEDEKESEDEDEDEDEDEGQSEKDDLFSLTSLTPMSSRPSSPMHIDPVVSQESRTLLGPHPPEETRETEVSAPIVRHFRSPSRELSYFDPVPQRHAPTPSPEVQPTQPSTTPQTVHRQPPSADPPAVLQDSGVSSTVLGHSWSFTDRAMAGLAANPPDLHPFSIAAHTQSFPLRHFAFPPASASTSASTTASTSRASPLPPPETSATPQARRPLDIVRDRLRREAQNRSRAVASDGSGSRPSLSLPPPIAPPRATSLASPSATILTTASAALRPVAAVQTVPTPLPSTTGLGPAGVAPQRTPLPSTTASTSQPTGHVAPLSAATPHPTTVSLSTTSPSTTALPTTAPLMTAPLPTSTPVPPAASLSSDLQTLGVSLPSSTPPTQAEGSPSQPSRVCRGHRTTTQLLPGISTRLGPPLLDEGALEARLPTDVYPIDHDNPELLLNMVFSRDFISQTFGGSSKRKCTVCRDGRPLLFANPTFDSHLPLCPGVSGLLFHASRIPGWKPGPNALFIETRTAQHWYLGDYKLEEMASALTIEEYVAWPVEIKRKWAEDIMNKMMHRDVRVGIVLRRRLGREPDELELANAVSDGDDYKDVSRDEIIQAYEQGHQTMSIFRVLCVGYDVAFMSDAARRLPAYLARRAEQQAVQEPRPGVARAA